MDLPSTSRRQSDVATTTSASNHNIWDSAWNACTQVPPPNLTDVLGAYAQKGDGDREMLLNILKAKSAEDQRIAAVASLHQTILQLQAQAVSAHLANQPLLNGLSTPTPTPPMQSPPPPFQHRSYYPPPAHHHGGSPLHDSSTTPTPNYPNHQTPYASHPTLPPISTIQSACPPSQEPSRKRSRVSSSSSSNSSNRPSPDYPLSPYSTGSGRSPRQQHSTRPHSGPYPPPSQHGRLAVSSLLGVASEEDGDVKYRRLSAERSTR